MYYDYFYVYIYIALFLKLNQVPHGHYLLKHADNLYTILELHIPGINTLNHEPLSDKYGVKINVNFIISLLIYKASLNSK